MGQTIDAELTELNSIGYPAGVSTGDPADAGATNPAALNLPGTPDVEGAYNILPAAPY